VYATEDLGAVAVDHYEWEGVAELMERMRDIVCGSLGVSPAQMQPGSGHSLQVLSRITGFRAFRCYPSREMQN